MKKIIVLLIAIVMPAFMFASEAIFEIPESLCRPE